MTVAKLDENSRASMTGLLNTDGVTITRVKANASNHSLKANDAATGTDKGGDHAILDENFRPTMYALSSADGVTKVALYVDSSGNLLIQST